MYWPRGELCGQPDRVRVPAAANPACLSHLGRLVRREGLRVGDQRALGAVEVLKAEQKCQSDLRGVKTTPCLPRTSNSACASAFFSVS